MFVEPRWNSSDLCSNCLVCSDLFLELGRSRLLLCFGLSLCLIYHSFGQLTYHVRWLYFPSLVSLIRSWYVEPLCSSLNSVLSKSWGFAALTGWSGACWYISSIFCGSGLWRYCCHFSAESVGLRHRLKLLVWICILRWSSDCSSLPWSEADCCLGLCSSARWICSSSGRQLSEGTASLEIVAGSTDPRAGRCWNWWPNSAPITALENGYPSSLAIDLHQHVVDLSQERLDFCQAWLCGKSSCPSCLARRTSSVSHLVGCWHVAYHREYDQTSSPHS